MSTDRSDQLPADTWRWLHAFARFLGSWIFVPPFRLQVHGRERIPRTGPTLLVVNHSSMLDGPIVFGLVRRPVVFLVKQEMFRGVLGVILARIGQLALRRNSAHREPLLAAIRILKAGGMVGVFPEGARGTGDVAEAENGAAWLARAANAVVLPVACRGTRKVAGVRQFRRKIDVLIGKPIKLSSQRGRAGLQVATEQLRVALADLVHELDLLRNETPDRSADAGRRAETGEGK
ncbi:MAG TPA: lysophospholipid acyltransferase family protein [Pseudonocardiaceae bacterium]|jgi:1-acyl-sn-glycerol-3-phosphate acyltransferase|nr:lysophospholipid acyltransferase family protein [Pseudonocardiaceae bacterium]